MLYAGSKPGMFEPGPLWPVQPGFLPFSPCTAKSSQTDIQSSSKSNPVVRLYRECDSQKLKPVT